MLMRTIVTLMAVVVFGTSSELADAHKARKHHPHAHIARDEVRTVLPAPYGGRLVAHPASNIACNTRDRATRALPCDQPVWVYGSPCEVDVGLGRYRSCE